MSGQPSAPPPDYSTATGQGYAPQGQGYAQQGYPQQGYAQQGGTPYPTQPVPQGGYGGYGTGPKPPEPVRPQPGYYNWGNRPDEDEEAHTEVQGSTFDLSSFSDKAIRRAFIKKVYLILMTQLLITFGFVCLFSLVQPIEDWIRGPGTWFYYVSYATFLVTYFVLVCCPGVRRNYPGNFICLLIFTLAFSYLVGTISSYYETGSVFVAAGITAAVCLAISLFAIQTKIDFTMCTGLLFALVMVLIFFGFACMIVYFTMGYNRILDAVYGGLAALVFSLFLVYDTQMLIGGRKVELSPEEHIFGALQLYIDVVYIFLIILALFGKSD